MELIRQLLFGGVKVSFKTSNPGIRIFLTSKYEEFLSQDLPEVAITVKVGKPVGLIFENLVFKTDNWEYFRETDYSAIRMLTPGRPTRRSHYTIVLNAKGDKGDLYFEDIPWNSKEVLSITVPPFALDEVLAVQLLGMKRGVMLHSCALITNNKQGLLFAGTSGDGKSTTAKLWQSSGKAVLLGDERVAVRKRDGKFWLISTAWHGSGQVVGPGCVPLHHLFIIHHAKENHAKRLEPSEAVKLLLARAYLPFWDRTGMEFSMEILEDLSNTIPCYSLGFTLDQRAVEYVECLLAS